MSYRSYRDTTSIKKKITEAFKVLRKNRIFARQNFWCCSSCGCYDVGQKYEDKKFADKYSLGWCFYHNQDNANLKETGKVYLTFGSADQSNDNFAAAVGYMIVGMLEQAGLKTDWDGSPMTRIRIVGELPVENKEAA